MSFQVNLRQIWTEGSDEQNDQVSYEVDAVDKRDVTVDQADTLVEIAFTLAQLVAYYVVSDSECYLRTNAANGAGGDTILLEAGVPLVWHTDSQHAKHFTQNVTKIYLDNPNVTDGSAPEVTIRIAKDSTP